jgi:hypothetical protein
VLFYSPQIYNSGYLVDPGARELVGKSLMALANEISVTTLLNFLGLSFPHLKKIIRTTEPTS